jgi:hypothetical protein
MSRMFLYLDFQEKQKVDPIGVGNDIFNFKNERGSTDREVNEEKSSRMIVSSDN